MNVKRIVIRIAVLIVGVILLALLARMWLASNGYYDSTGTVNQKTVSSPLGILGGGQGNGHLQGK